MMRCHLTPNSINVPPEMSRQTQQHSACTTPTPWRSRPPGSTCQALPSTTRCSLACPPGGRCWYCTRWFAGFVAGTMETGAHVDPDADCERWREISCHGDDETGTQVPVKRLVLHHFSHTARSFKGCESSVTTTAEVRACVLLGGGCTLQRGTGPVDQLCLRADFKEAEVGFHTIRCAPVQRHVVVTMRVAPRS